MPPRPPHPNAARLAAPAVLAKIRRVIPRRLPAADADDIAQKVILALLLVDPLPETDDGLLRFAAVVTKHTTIDHFRKIGRALKRETDVDEDGVEELLAIPDPDAAERELLDRAMEALRDAAARKRIPASAVEIATMLRQGMTYAEIAEKTERPEAAIRKEMQRAFAHLREHWQKYAAGAGLVAVLLLVFVVKPHLPKSDRDIITADTSTASPTSPAPAASTLPYGVAIRTDAGPMLQAMDLTRRAEFECGAQDWDACERTLDEASQLEPPLDPARELRQRIDNARRYPDGGAPPLKPPVK